MKRHMLKPAISTVIRASDMSRTDDVVPCLRWQVVNIVAWRLGEGKVMYYLKGLGAIAVRTWKQMWRLPRHLAE